MNARHTPPTSRAGTTPAWLKWLVVLVAGQLLVALLSSGAAAEGEQASPRALADAQQYLVEHFGGRPTDYELLAERETIAGTMPMWSGKFVDTRTGEVRLVYRDAAGVVGGPEFRRVRIAAQLDALAPLERKASPGLLQAVTAAASRSDRLPVALWMDVDTSEAVAAVKAAHPEVAWIGDRPTSTDPATQRALRRALEDARAQAYRQAAAEIAAIVARYGGTLGYVSLLAPLVYVDTPATALDDLAALDRVRSLGLESTSWVESLSSAGPYVSADWHTGSLDQGTGVRVAVVEYYNVRATGDLAGKVGAFHSESGSTTYTPSGSFDHPTWVAGAIASQNSTYTGIAPGAVIVSSGTGGGSAGLTRDRNVIAAADWAATTGDADIINLSVNMDNATGWEEARAYFDAISGGETFRTVVASSGNYGTGAYNREWWVSSPGVGWNVLTVGGVDDGTNRLWYDNDPAYGALWDEKPDWSFNPHNDFNKPNVSAPAVNVRTANGLSATGTSAAAPIVSGVAAQLFARDPATFSVWPEAMRAIIMAGANRRVPLATTGQISPDHEGVGTVNALWSHRIFVRGAYGGWAKGTMTSTTSVSQSFEVAAGQRIRIVLAWDSHTSGPMFDKTDTLTADLDLSVQYPGGTAFSSSWDNNYEFVSFTAPSSGTVTVNVAKPRFDAPSEYWALAWLKW